MQVLPSLPDSSVELIYVDPPFNTGAVQRRTRLRTVQAEAGDRTGFKGKRYRTQVVGSSHFEDTYDDYAQFIWPRLLEAHRVLAETGTLYFHIDYREVHYCKLLLDRIFGRDRFLNEIIWAYDYGVPYLAPGLVGADKAARGKTPTDTWWHTIVSPQSKERTGYPTQKPLPILCRIIRASSRPGDVVLDFFAGSGTTGEAAGQLGRRFILVDNNPEAISIMRRRLAPFAPTFVEIV